MKQTVTGRWMGAVVALACAASMTTGAQQTDPRALFERARLLEENPRHLARAIETYRQVMADAGDDRALAGAAQLQIGLVLERQGDAGARDVFARVARDFGDQPALVSAARNRLTAGGAQIAELTPRRVGVEPAFPNAVSPDGLRIATTTADGHLGLSIRNVTSSDWTSLVPGAPSNMPQFPIFSPDGRLVAFRLLTAPGVPTAGVSVVETTPGATPRTVLPPYALGKSPVAWSADGRALLLYSPSVRAVPELQIAETGAELDWVDIETGVVRNIRRFEAWRRVGQSGLGGIRGVSLSPDGSTIAFSASAREESGGARQAYLFLMDADGGNERAVVQIAGMNVQPRWTPDGSHLLFVNLRSGQRALMSVPIRAGAAAGEPRVVQANFSGYLVDMTHTGDLYYMSEASRGFSMFVAERGTTAPRIVETFKGQSGAWSRGGRLAFVRPGSDGQDLIVRSMATGEERQYQHQGITVVSPRWFSDDSAVIVYVNTPAVNVQFGGAFYRVDLASGAFTHLLDLNRDGRLRSSVSALSPDDTTLYTFVRNEPQGAWNALIGINIATGEERTIFTVADGGLPGASLPGIAVSPDGQTLAIQAATNTQDGRIFTVRVDGTGYREVHNPVPDGAWGADAIRWTPDGQFLVFTAKEGTGPTAPWRTMIVPAAGGAASPDGLDSSKFTATVPLPLIEIGNVANIDLSPDGSHIVFGSRTIPTYDLWVLENVPAYLTR